MDAGKSLRNATRYYTVSMPVYCQLKEKSVAKLVITCYYILFIYIIFSVYQAFSTFALSLSAVAAGYRVCRVSLAR